MNIKVNDDELKRISERIDDMSRQLIDANSNNANAFSAINGEIQTSSINSTLNNYSDTCVRVVSALNKSLIELKEFLDRQLASYSATDQEAFDAIKSVSDYLSGLGAGVTATTGGASSSIQTPKEGMTPEQFAEFKADHSFNKNGASTSTASTTINTPKEGMTPGQFAEFKTDHSFNNNTGATVNQTYASASNIKPNYQDASDKLTK